MNNAAKYCRITTIRNYDIISQKEPEPRPEYTGEYNEQEVTGTTSIEDKSGLNQPNVTLLPHSPVNMWLQEILLNDPIDCPALLIKFRKNQKGKLNERAEKLLNHWRNSTRGSDHRIDYQTWRSYPPNYEEIDSFFSDHYEIPLYDFEKKFDPKLEKRYAYIDDSIFCLVPREKSDISHIKNIYRRYKCGNSYIDGVTLDLQSLVEIECYKYSSREQIHDFSQFNFNNISYDNQLKVIEAFVKQKPDLLYQVPLKCNTLNIFKAAASSMNEDQSACLLTMLNNREIEIPEISFEGDVLKIDYSNTEERLKKVNEIKRILRMKIESKQV